LHVEAPDNAAVTRGFCVTISALVSCTVNQVGYAVVPAYILFVAKGMAVWDIQNFQVSHSLPETLLLYKML